GKVVCLEDTDGDGRFDKSVVFADQLSFPSGIACYDGGVFVVAKYEIIYLKDTDGDGKADIRRVALEGFGSGTAFIPARAVNGFAWGLDNRFYGSGSGNGGVVHSLRNGEKGEGVDIRRKDFSFDPRDLAVRPESGTAQFGLTFDEFGRRFVC